MDLTKATEETLKVGKLERIELIEKYQAEIRAIDQERVNRMRVQGESNAQKQPTDKNIKKVAEK